MAQHSYRTAVYEDYRSMQAPQWGDESLRKSAVWRAAAVRRMRNWLPSDKNAKCLDLGCGDGRFLDALRSSGFRDVYGVDLAPQAVELARIAGFQVARADLRDYLLESQESFDLITAFDVIEHFAKDEVFEVLGLIYRHLRPGGAFVLQTPNALSPWAGSLRYGDLTHEVIYSPTSIASLLRHTGFKNIETRHVRPYFHGLKRVIWCPLWRTVLLAYAVWNLAETGSLLGGVYTRNMLVRATRDSVI